MIPYMFVCTFYQSNHDHVLLCIHCHMYNMLSHHYINSYNSFNKLLEGSLFKVYNKILIHQLLLQISKSSVIDDIVESNDILYPDGKGPDHCVVIKYVPHVGDTKRAMDEYTSEIMMGGSNTLIIHNTCEDSLLASPLIIDLVVLAELCERIQYKTEHDSNFQKFNSVLSVLSYLCKAPLVPYGTPVINSLFRQRSCIENILRACIGLSPVSHMLLEYKHAHIDKRIHKPVVATKKPTDNETKRVIPSYACHLSEEIEK